jgi:hypothetical protein
MNQLTIYITGFFIIAAFFALAGTNTQARISRNRLLQDADPQIAEAGKLWRPIRWLTKPSIRKTRRALELQLKRDSQQWARYKNLCAELFAWNALESGVAMALSASLLALVHAIVLANS